MKIEQVKLTTNFMSRYTPFGVSNEHFSNQIFSTFRDTRPWIRGKVKFAPQNLFKYFILGFCIEIEIVNDDDPKLKIEYLRVTIIY